MSAERVSMRRVREILRLKHEGGAPLSGYRSRVEIRGPTHPPCSACIGASHRLPISSSSGLARNYPQDGA
jgi:hypothetical protein